MGDDFEARCRLIVEECLGAPAEAGSFRRLEGGVASDIAVLQVRDREVCVKCALPRLKVAQRWEAPVRRNRAEYDWLSYAGGVEPSAAPHLYGRSAGQGGFAMEYVEPAAGYLWKGALLRGENPRGEAQAVGSLLARLHAASTAAGFDTAPFENRDDFRSLRIDPYLLRTAAVHPAAADRLRRLADSLFESRIALIHGDVSPKNIILRGGRPMLLDAECATIGDPAFDVAFCLNHLVLKAVHVKLRAAAYLAEAQSLWRAYAAGVTWEEPSTLGGRVAELLPGLMLARIDGKSPVEYLSEADRNFVRESALSLLAAQGSDPAALLAVIAQRLDERHAG